MRTRREILKGTAALSLAGAMPAVLARPAAAADFSPKPAGWRQFELVTKMEIAPAGGAAQAWIPLPSMAAADWMRPMASDWAVSAGTAALHRDAKSGAELVHATWAPGAAPAIEVRSRFATRDRAIDLAGPADAAALSEAERARYTEPAALMPLDGIVKETADKVVGEARTDVDKARRIYEWIVVNTYRNGQTRGCGTGDIASMLRSGNLGGKCADLNALFVGLARAAGLPARDLYGIRVASSKFGYRSLGTSSENVTRAQHCRAEVHLAGFGWVPVDPADVRKVVLEEPPGNLPIDHPAVGAARKTLFGAWEGNWLAYNDAHDLMLPGAAGPRLDFLMYPQAETAAAGRLDCLDPDSVRYTITVREIAI